MKKVLRKWINGEHEQLLNPLNAETGLWDPIFELEEDAHTHTHTHTHLL